MEQENQAQVTPVELDLETFEAVIFIFIWLSWLVRRYDYRGNSPTVLCSHRQASVTQGETRQQWTPSPRLIPGKEAD